MAIRGSSILATKAPVGHENGCRHPRAFFLFSCLSRRNRGKEFANIAPNCGSKRSNVDSGNRIQWMLVNSGPVVFFHLLTLGRIQHHTLNWQQNASLTVVKFSLHAIFAVLLSIERLAWTRSGRAVGLQKLHTSTVAFWLASRRERRKEAATMKKISGLEGKYFWAVLNIFLGPSFLFLLRLTKTTCMQRA